MNNRDLDKLVAEKIMGWTDLEMAPTGGFFPSLFGTPPMPIDMPKAVFHIAAVPFYSSRIDDALLVVDKMKQHKDFFQFRLQLDHNEQKWGARFWMKPHLKPDIILDIVDVNPATAICKSALDVLEERLIIL